MRKFRAWNDETKQWEFSLYVCINGAGDVLHTHRDNFIEVAYQNCPYLKIQFFTGLKDKNGKEIYEGDILQHELWKIPVKVFWEFGSFMAQSVKGELGRKNYTDGTLYDMQLPRCKIIGNIYENPELLK